MPRITNIKVRRGSSVEWDQVNPVLDDGELGYDKTNKIIKIGNGITPWKNLSFLARINPVILQNNSLYVEKLSIRSPLIDFKESNQIGIFSIPEGYVFSIDSLEVLTIQIVSPGVAPIISLGNDLNSNEYFGPLSLVGSSAGDRHVIENPQNAVFENLSVFANIISTSTADIHTGFIVISGSLIKI